MQTKIPKALYSYRRLGAELTVFYVAMVTHDDMRDKNPLATPKMETIQVEIRQAPDFFLRSADDSNAV